MDKFLVFLEKRERNPLRKQDLADKGHISNKDFIEREKENLPQERLDQIQKMEEYGVEPERIETFRQAKLKEHEKELKRSYLRAKPSDNAKLLFTKYGIKVYLDNNAPEDAATLRNIRVFQSSIDKLIKDYKDILPNRKPIFVITDTEKNIHRVKQLKTTPRGFYRDRIIYMDSDYLHDYQTLIHEYAHFIADRIPKQTEPILKQEYKNMLDAYFIEATGKATRRDALQGVSNAANRKKMAAKMGLPTAYASTNFDEWFAEVIAYWKDMPNNKNTYKLKSVMKKILTRV